MHGENRMFLYVRNFKIFLLLREEDGLKMWRGIFGLQTGSIWTADRK
jgi:hypothetical protein